MDFADRDTIERAMRLRRMMNEMLRGLSPYKRDCMMSVHLAEMHGQPVDQVAKRVIDDAVQRSNEKWRLERERERSGAGSESAGGSDQELAAKEEDAMAAEQDKCPLCGQLARLRLAPGAHDLRIYTNCSCKGYSIWARDQIEFLDNRRMSPLHLERIRILLYEWRLNNRGTPALQFRSASYPQIGDTLPVRISDLLATWPKSIPERLERGLCNLVSSTRYARVGKVVEIRRRPMGDPIFFSEDAGEERFFVEAMISYGWLRQTGEGDSSHWHIWLTPTGWEKYGQLTRREGDAKDPAFVAMWFGKAEAKEKDRSEEMTRLFDEAILPAIKNAGYVGKRAVADEHNEPIMDRIIADIRVAPFVVVELTNNSQNVYYEAGFAQGVGKEVIYCRNVEVDAHFDLSGLNHVEWRDSGDLRRRLENRILRTRGPGPYKVPQDNAIGVNE